MTSYLVSCPDCGHRFPVERDTMRAVWRRGLFESLHPRAIPAPVAVISGDNLSVTHLDPPDDPLDAA